MTASAEVFDSSFPLGFWASLFDAGHGLPPVGEVLAARGCSGVSRYRTGSGDCPALSLTVSWGRTGALVERVSAFISLGPVPRQVGPASAWSAWVPHHLLPRLLRGWPAALSSFAAAPSVNRLAGVDGFSAHHSWAGPDGDGEAEWVWPDGRDQGQRRLIGAYGRLALAGWLCSWRGIPAEVAERRTRRCT